MHCRPGFAFFGILALGLLGAAASCSSDERRPDASNDGGLGGGGADAGPIPEPSWPRLDCDPLVPSYCGFPFPSNVFTTEDASSPTGRRVTLAPGALPVASGGAVTLPDPWAASDGFSTGAAILAHFPGATGEGLPPPVDLEASLAADAQTVLLDAETGERVVHFSELDRSGSDDAARALLIRPMIRLRDGRRYIVAVRGLRGAGGVLEPSPAFRALRDGTPSGDPAVEGRRDLYRNIFAELERAGIEQGSLQLAWDFTTASRENNTGRFLRMRDRAFETVGSAGPEYAIVSVEQDPWPEIAFKLELTVRTPLFLGAPGPGSNLLLDPDGLPVQNTEQPTVDVPVEVLIPNRALTEPAGLIQYGHGLLGRRSQIESGHFRSFIDQYGYILFGVDLWGMAEEDILYIAGVLGAGELHRLSTMFDRLHQGMLNSLMAMRAMHTTFAADPTYGGTIDPERRYYYGISQGGIFGGVYMAVTTDVARGVLGVMGQPYNLLLNRSIDFDPFFSLLNDSYPSALDQQLGLTLIQMLWDRLEPNGYTPHIQEDLLPGTPPHEVLMRVALGDHQVNNLGARLMARSVGATHLETGLGSVYGLETASEIAQGSSYIEYDFGLPEDPPCNVPPRACDDPHGKVRTLEAAREQMDLFLRAGITRNFCPAGVCSYPELSGCAPGETNAAACE
jgi:hypothetical protein